jgi:hypothetical protein
LSASRNRWPENEKPTIDWQSWVSEILWFPLKIRLHDARSLSRAPHNNGGFAAMLRALAGFN